MKMWYWCFECQRCFSVSVPDDKLFVVGLKDDTMVPDKCIYPGCTGTHYGFRIWDFVRKTVKTLYQIEYPEIPERFKVYPLCPENEGTVPVLRK